MNYMSEFLLRNICCNPVCTRHAYRCRSACSAAAECGWMVGWIQHCCLLSPVPPPPHPACSV